MMQGLYGHLEDELETAGFFHPPEKKPSMVRNLRAVFARSSLNEQEVRTLRGVVTALSRGRGQVLAKLAAKKDQALKEASADSAKKRAAKEAAQGGAGGNAEDKDALK